MEHVVCLQITGECLQILVQQPSLFLPLLTISKCQMKRKLDSCQGIVTLVQLCGHYNL